MNLRLEVHRADDVHSGVIVMIVSLIAFYAFNTAGKVKTKDSQPQKDSSNCNCGNDFFDF